MLPRSVFPFILLLAMQAPAYSVLTHEAIIDSSWDPQIKQLLLKRFPRTTADELNEAHAYAYGGCIIQDMGYYPFGSKFFSDLVHYVHSGDFVEEMLRDAQDVNEYAFALGALAHYAADNSGHPTINRVTPMLDRKLRRRFGNVVTYEDDPAAHLKTEFGFDVLQVAAGNYASQAYHDFIGFKVSKPLLERAFPKVYGAEFDRLFAHPDLALGTYRHTVSSLIPEATKAAWDLKKKDLQKATPGVARSRFVYRISAADYRKEWDEKYERPGAGARVLALIFRLIPKVGPFRALKFHPPTAQTAQMFAASFAETQTRYRTLLAQERARTLHLANTNLDVGKPLPPGEYHLADETAAKLKEKLVQKDSARNPD